MGRHSKRHGVYAAAAGATTVVAGLLIASSAASASAVVQDPVARDDSYITNVNTTLHRNAPGVLANDTDPAGSALYARLTAPPLHGSLTLNADGSFTYAPAGNYTGLDHATYQACRVQVLRAIQVEGDGCDEAIINFTIRGVEGTPTTTPTTPPALRLTTCLDLQLRGVKLPIPIGDLNLGNLSPRQIAALDAGDGWACGVPPASPTVIHETTVQQAPPSTVVVQPPTEVITPPAPVFVQPPSAGSQVQPQFNLPVTH